MGNQCWERVWAGANVCPHRHRRRWTARYGRGLDESVQRGRSFVTTSSLCWLWLLLPEDEFQILSVGEHADQTWHLAFSQTLCSWLFIWVSCSVFNLYVPVVCLCVWMGSWTSWKVSLIFFSIYFLFFVVLWLRGTFRVVSDTVPVCTVCFSPLGYVLQSKQSSAVGVCGV